MQGLPIISWDENEVDIWGDLHIHDRTTPTLFWSLKMDNLTDSGTWSGNSDITKNYQVTGRGLVIASISVLSDSSNDTGTAATYIDLRTANAFVTTLATNANRLTATATTSIHAGSTGAYYFDGASGADRLRLYAGCTKSGTNRWYLNIVTIGCTVEAI